MSLLENPTCFPNSTINHDPFSFAILISGLQSRDPEHAEFYSCKLSTNSLHIVSEKDSVVPIEASKRLADCFTSKHFLYHDGG